jgi:tripartite-type tricarboxylate transporter receptor subunit TctC
MSKHARDLRPHVPPSEIVAVRDIEDLVASVAALSTMPEIVCAQAYPSRPVRIIVGFPAGGGSDILARLIAHWLSERLSENFIVENRPGAATNVATEAVARAAPDGYTLLMFSTSTLISASLYDKLDFNFSRDVAPVASISRGALAIVVNPFVPAKTLDEFISYAKANPGMIAMASAGTGSAPHVAGELFKMMAGINMLHVPYRGDTPALMDLLGGQVQVYFSTLFGSMEYIRSARLRALAVTTAKRAEPLPEVPTVSEILPGYEASVLNGLGVPAGTTPEIIAKLNNEINQGIAAPTIELRLRDLGVAVLANSPDQLKALIAEEIGKWSKVVKSAGIKADWFQAASMPVIPVTRRAAKPLEIHPTNFPWI